MAGAPAGNRTGMTDDTFHTERPVLAGVDGSPGSLAAADLAAAEAELRGVPLELVHALVLPMAAGPATVPDLPPMAPGGPRFDDAPVREYASRLLDETAARARATHPDLPVVTRLRDGYPAGVLTDASRQASLVVVGHRGGGGFTDLLTGSVAIQLANHAACPVIVVRGRGSSHGSAPVGDPAPAGAPGSAPDRTVVVGVDGSEGSRRAAEFAAAAAARYRAPLIAVYAWPPDAAWPPALAQAGHPPPRAPERISETPVAETLADLTERFPELPVRPEIHQHTPAHEALLAAAKDARLVVVGARGRGGFRGLLLGSVSQALIHHAPCPVAVVGPGAGSNG